MQNEGWNFENTYIELPKIFYRSQRPEVALNPEMVIFNHNLAEYLGIDTWVNSMPEFLAGSLLPPGANPISQAYAGYQFGHFAKLGDGRAVLLGEQTTPDGHKFDIQLKGSGQTPFSRRGDGYAALLPMLREYIVSEAMYFLGIPTTRSLAVVLSGKNIIREKILKGAVLTRVASSHIRVGTFNHISKFGTKEDLRILADYSIQRHFPELENQENKYILFLRQVAKLQASLIASWQLVGFVHGVMNTDNMTISGETIDYGPCAFMDVYDPNTVFSSIDSEGRYAYKNQPAIGAWNLSRFAEELLPLLHEDEKEAISLAENEISYYWKCFNTNWFSGMCGKLGIINEKPEDADYIEEFLGLVATHKLDYTNSFRSLVFLAEESVEKTSTLFEVSGFAEWHKKWQTRLTRQPKNQNIPDIMKKNNPSVIARNHRVEEALSAAENGDFTVMHNLLAALTKPYEDSKEYSQPPVSGNCGYKTFCGT